MTPTEHSSKTPRFIPVFFALLGGLLPGKGTGAPSFRTPLLLVSFIVGSFLFAATPALANSAHAFTQSLGVGPGTGAGELELVAPFREVEGNETVAYVAVAGSGVAVDDATHDVYVADTGNHRIDQFDPSKPPSEQFMRAWGWGVAGGLGFQTCGPDALVATCVAGAEGSAPGELSAPNFVAVDNDPSSPSYRDVYVGDGVGKEAASDQQFIQFPGTTGGTYTLTFEGQTTAPIDLTTPLENLGPAGVNAVAVREALEHLTTIGNGNVHVDEFASRAVGLRVVFQGALAEKVVPQLTADGSALTPMGAGVEVHTKHEGSRFSGEVISRFSPEGRLEESWGVKGQLDGSTAEEGPFLGKLEGIAVGCNGDLWVLDARYKYEFEPNGAYVAGSTARTGNGSASGIGVNCEGNLSVAPVSSTGLALDQATSESYLDLGTSIEHSGETFGGSQLAAGGGAGVAVDGSVGEPPVSGTVYAANTASDELDAFGLALVVNTGSASKVTATTAVLEGEVDPEDGPVEECDFEYGTSTEYYEHSVPCEQSAEAIGQGTSPVPVGAKISGLLVGTTYRFRLVAKHENAETHEVTTVPGEGERFTTPVGAVLSGEEATEVTAGGARLNALLDPEGLPVTRCEFEYGTSTAYSHVARCEQRLAQIGTGTVPVSVSAQITGLSPNVTYHWRLSVKDPNGEAYAPDHTLIYSTVGAELPDHRAYEMVTPVRKDGASFGSVFYDFAPDISEDGLRVIAPTIQCFPPSEQAPSESCTGLRDSTGEPFEFTRTSTGWQTTAMAPPANQFSANSMLQIGANDGVGLFSMPTGPEGEDEWYARSPAGSFAAIGPATPPGITGVEGYTLRSKATTADLSTLVWETDPGDLNFLWPFDETEKKADSLYEYSGTANKEPFLVGVSNKGKPKHNTESELVATCGTELGGGIDDTWNALSEDGRTVYFTVCRSELYARLNGATPAAETVKISQSQCGTGSGVAEAACRKAPASEARFEGASADGSKAFFLDTAQLADGATESVGAAKEACELASDCNLYLYDFDQPVGQRLIDVSAPEASGEDPRVQGVTAISGDGSHVYFVAKGVLTSRANGQGQGARPGADNLYLYERDPAYPQGHMVFVATLSSSDNVEDWGETAVPFKHANVTPDGRFLVFESDAHLTADDTAGGIQIFRYDAETEELVRVSIGDDGFDDDGSAGSGEAKIVTSQSTEAHVGPARGDPTMSNDGSYVFFSSPIALTPHALDDVVAGTEAVTGKFVTVYAENVYEYHEGHVYLISDGRDVGTSHTPCGIAESAVCLLGTDASGANVFFTTGDRLVPKDTDTQVDIYDARICEPEQGNPCISEPSPPLPPCDGEACHGIPATTPSLLAPGSATFNGEGNVITPPPPAVVKKVTKKTAKCKKVVVKKKGKKKTECLAKKSSKKAKKAKRASNDRRAGR